MAFDKLVHAGDHQLVRVPLMACVKMSPGGARAKGSAANLAAGKSVRASEQALGVDAEWKMACAKLDAGGEPVLVFVGDLASGKIEPGGESVMGIVLPLAAGKVVAEGDYSMDIVTSLASGKL